MQTEERLLECAAEAGFDLAGLAPLRPPRSAERFRAWLAAGRHGGMGWLKTQSERICDPRRVLPEGHLILCLGVGHARPALVLGDGARIARYAAGRDYHNVIGKRLRKLGKLLVQAGLIQAWRSVVDAGPLLERSHAAEAGLGFESKAANLLHQRYGPWFFLGEILLQTKHEDPAPASPPASAIQCGTCTACLDACPTGALIEPGVLDARLCLSYQTIENRGTIPHELRRALGPWVFGCDVCSEVCPFGRRAPEAPGASAQHPAVASADLADWLQLGRDANLEELLVGSPLNRPGAEGLRRNAALVLGNLPSERGESALRHALEDSSPLIREAAAHGLLAAHGHVPGHRLAVERACQRETDAEAAAGMDKTLDRLGQG